MKHSTFRQILTVIMVTCLSSLFLMGCVDHYKEDDAEKLVNAGKEIMETYINEHVPDGQLLSAEAYYKNNFSPRYLTSYVKGSYKDNDGEYIYIVDTVNNTVYTGKHFAEVSPVITEAIPSLTGFELKGIDEVYGLALPGIDKGEYFYEPVLPADITDISSYVLDPDNRLPFYLTGMTVIASADTDLHEYDIATIMKWQKQCGLICNELNIVKKDNSECIELFRENEQYYKHFTEKDIGDFTIRYRDEIIEEYWDPADEKLLAKAAQSFKDIDKYLKIEQTSEGYSIRFFSPDRLDEGKTFRTTEPVPELVIMAQEGSALLNERFLARSYKKDGTNTYEHELTWVMQDDGWYVLSNADDHLPFYISLDTDLIRQ